MPDKHNILVIKLGALGDFVQALGPMAAIRRHHPDAEITLLTTAPFVTFGRECGYFNHVWVDERPKWKQPLKWLSLRKRFLSGNFARVYDLQNNDRTSLYFRLLGKRQRPEWVGIAKGASHRNNDIQRTSGSAFNGHVQTLALAGIDDIEIDTLDWVQGDLDIFSLQKPYILIVPGSAPRRLEKRWPVQNYIHLMRVLHDWGFQCVVLGTDAEKDLTHEMCQNFPQAANLTARTSVMDIVTLARHAAGAIGNDTGPMHLIAPTGCPSFVIFSNFSDPVRHAPQGKNVNIIQGNDLKGLKPEDILQIMSKENFRVDI